MPALIKQVLGVSDHPTKDSISVIKLDDAQFVAQKLEGGIPRYSVGDLVMFVPDANIMPEYLLRQGYWDDAEGRGILKGKGDRVKAGNFAGVRSDGIHFAVVQGDAGAYVTNGAGDILDVKLGDDVGEFMGITAWAQ